MQKPDAGLMPGISDPMAASTPADVDPRCDSLTWRGKVATFAPVYEGGPGRPLSLILTTVLGLVGIVVMLVEIYAWRWLYYEMGIATDGVVTVLAGVTGIVAILTVLIMVGLRVGLRETEVTFSLTPDLAQICASSRQHQVDAVIAAAAQAISRYKQLGGAEMLPATALGWYEVRRVVYIPERREILLKARRGNLRFHCPDASIWTRARAIVESHRPEMGQVNAIGMMRPRPRGA